MNVLCLQAKSSATWRTCGIRLSHRRFVLNARHVRETPKVQGAIPSIMDEEFARSDIELGRGRILTEDASHSGASDVLEIPDGISGVTSHCTIRDVRRGTPEREERVSMEGRGPPTRE